MQEISNSVNSNEETQSNSNFPEMNSPFPNIEPVNNLSQNNVLKTQISQPTQNSNLNNENLNTSQSNIQSTFSNSDDLPSFDSDSENDDILIPTPPPNLMENTIPEIYLDELEDVEDKYLIDKEHVEALENVNKIKKELKTKNPIFIKVENFDSILRKMDEIQNYTKKFEDSLFNIENFNDNQKTKLVHLHKDVENLQRKLIYVDNIIFEKRGD